ncbi:MAG: GDYXXLXY domain-containing protein [Proteobacteria bacterium]|nr:GDYXXLXY domain-containing protein [Pseudomonadota bacterium]
MKLDAPPRILAVAGLCAAILVGFVINEGSARATGQEVLLSVEGVDPRDLLSGHYVQLAFNRRLDPGEQCPRADPTWNWTALRARGDIYVVAGGASSSAGVEQVGPVTVRASYSCSPPSPADANRPPGESGVLHLDLGIDRFYVSQAEAQRIERALAEQRSDSKRRVLAIVSIGRDGIARLKGLVIDGRRMELNWL